MSKNLNDYSKDELVEIVKSLKRRKKFGLVWEDKPEEVALECRNNLPVLDEVKQNYIEGPDGPTNVIIEGDNYHSLTTLNFTHHKSVDVIYIDPPYNTGATAWRYNNDYVDGDDTFRHSKWLSFMEKRLRLSKKLLKDTGIIVVTIDDYEAATLTLLMNEIFGYENHLGTVVIRNNPQGRSTIKGFSVTHEYALFYGSTQAADVGRLPRTEKQLTRYPDKDEYGKGYVWENFRKTGSDSLRKDRPKQFYPLVISKQSEVTIPEMTWNDEKSEWSFNDNLSENQEIVWPVDSKGNERVWKWGYERVIANPTHIKAKVVNGRVETYRRNYPSEGSLPRTLWDLPKYAAGSHGTNLLTKMFGRSHVFDYPKSVFAVEDCIRVGSSEKNAVVLDFFAGSGTTGQAVLNLNAQDGGQRKFILCTNNENEIAEEVTYPRIKNVIDGYGKVEGIPASVRYFRTSLVGKQQTDDQTRIELVARSTDMICLREDTFEPVIENKNYKVFNGPRHYSAIVFEPDAINELKQKLDELESDEPVHIYVFSLSNDTYENDFADLERTHELRPIPESILEVYRRIFNDQNVNIGA